MNSPARSPPFSRLPTTYLPSSSIYTLYDLHLPYTNCNDYTLSAVPLGISYALFEDPESDRTFSPVRREHIRKASIELYGLAAETNKYQRRGEQNRSLKQDTKKEEEEKRHGERRNATTQAEYGDARFDLEIQVGYVLIYTSLAVRYSSLTFRECPKAEDFSQVLVLIVLLVRQLRIVLWSTRALISILEVVMFRNVAFVEQSRFLTPRDNLQVSRIAEK